MAFRQSVSQQTPTKLPLWSRPWPEVSKVWLLASKGSQPATRVHSYAAKGPWRRVLGWVSGRPTRRSGPGVFLRERKWSQGHCKSPTGHPGDQSLAAPLLLPLPNIPGPGARLARTYEDSWEGSAGLHVTPGPEFPATRLVSPFLSLCLPWDSLTPACPQSSASTRVASRLFKFSYTFRNIIDIYVDRSVYIQREKKRIAAQTPTRCVPQDVYPATVN